MARQGRNPVTAPRGPSANIVLTIAIVALAVAVIGGILVIDRTSSAADDQGSIPEQLLATPGRNTVSEADRGDGEDEVTIVEFLDYQCPACAAYYGNVTKALEADYAGQVTFVTRNFPLEAHPLARQAAHAAEAAAKQGRYREMYHQLYDNYRQWALTPDDGQLSADEERASTLFDSYATAIGLDLDLFHRDASSAAVRERIDADLAAGTKVGVNSTPTIFVNGERFQPGGDRFTDVDRELRAMVDEALGR
jgi:protein-disulfide isomerase